jgi:hypothetical protein
MSAHLNWSRIGSLALSVFLLFGAASVAAEEKSSDDWVYDFEIYAWLPTIQPTLANGTDLNWSLSDLLKTLDMMAMFNTGARKDRWSMKFDLLYLNLGTLKSKTGEIVNHPVELDADIDLRAMPLTLTAGYQVGGSGKNQFDIIGGVRYLYISVPITLSLNGEFQEKVNQKVITWDGLIGFQGKSTINDKWYFDYYGDVGTGDSRLTWQAKVGGGYHFNKWTATFGYRYQRWNFESDEVLKHLTINGPYIGAKWMF